MSGPETIGSVAQADAITGVATPEPWAAHLPHVTADSLRVAVLRRRLRRRQRELPEGVLRRLCQALTELVPAGQRSRPWLEVTLVYPDGQRRRLVLDQPIHVLGRDPGCTVRLPSPAVAPRQAELRLASTGVALLALAPGLSIDGEPIETDQLHRLGDHAVLDLPPFRLVVSTLSGGESAPSARVTVRVASPLLAEQPLDSLQPGVGWLRISHGDWSGFTSLPASWTRRAADVLGIDSEPGVDPGTQPTENMTFGVPDEIDRALLQFVLRRVADRFAELTGVATQVAGPLSDAQTELLAARDRSGSEWAVAHLNLELAGESCEVAVIWCEPPRGAGPPGVELAPVGVSVEAGFTVLTRADLRGLEIGDVILPDRWTLGLRWPPGSQADVECDEDSSSGAPGASCSEDTSDDAEDASFEAAVEDRFDPEGEANPLDTDPRVRLLLPGDLSGHRLDAAVRVSDDRSLRLRVLEAWRLDGADAYSFEPDHRGAAMHDVSTPAGEMSDSPSGSSTLLGDDLRVALGFELQRLSVPLGDLRTWCEGKTLRLDRGPDDPIRLVLHQPGGSRLLGHGRVVVLDGRLGVVVESWLDAPGAEPGTALNVPQSDEPDEAA